MYYTSAVDQRFARLDASQRIIENVRVAVLNHQPSEERPGWWEEHNIDSLRAIADCLNTNRVPVEFQTFDPSGRQVIAKRIGHLADARVHNRRSVRADVHLNAHAFDGLALNSGESAFDFLSLDSQEDPHEFGINFLESDWPPRSDGVVVPTKIYLAAFVYNQKPKG